MFKASNKHSLFNESGSVAFKERIAPKIAAHIQSPIKVRVTGENTCLNAWLIENLSTILPLHIRLVSAGSQRPAKIYRKRAKYE